MPPPALNLCLCLLPSADTANVRTVQQQQIKFGLESNNDPIVVSSIEQFNKWKYTHCLQLQHIYHVAKHKYSSLYVVQCV